MTKQSGWEKTKLFNNVEVRIGDIDISQEIQQQKLRITLNELCTSAQPNGGNAIIQHFFDCQQEMEGRFVTLQKMNHGILAISEVRVFIDENYAENKILETAELATTVPGN